VICPTGCYVAPVSRHRHCDPTGRANTRPMTGSATRPPKLNERRRKQSMVLLKARVIASGQE
jgi:hypothetical protein